MSVSRNMAWFFLFCNACFILLSASWLSQALFFPPTDIMSTAEPGSAQVNLVAFITHWRPSLIASSASSLCARSPAKFIFAVSWRHDLFFYPTVILSYWLRLFFSIVVTSTLHFFCISHLSYCLFFFLLIAAHITLGLYVLFTKSACVRCQHSWHHYIHRCLRDTMCHGYGYHYIVCDFFFVLA